jgi:hypothetical protein
MPLLALLGQSSLATALPFWGVELGFLGFAVATYYAVALRDILMTEWRRTTPVGRTTNNWQKTV